MDEPKAFAEAVDKHVRPGSFPVAVRMVRPSESLPDRVKRPWADLGESIAICQGVAMARRYGWTLAMGREDLSCPLAKEVFGFEKSLGYFRAGHACAGMFTVNAGAGAVTESQVARFPWGASGRAMTMDAYDGLTKVIFDADTERVLGVGIVGRGAGEMIAEGVLAVEMGALAQDLALTMHPHPTLSETEGEAAEVFLGQATHILPRRQ